MAGLAKSFVHAANGLVYVFRHERNARIHLLFAVIVLILSAALRLSLSDLAIIFFAVIIVFLAEIFNTAIEKTLDIVEPNHHPQVKLIKDMAAGGVLVAAIAAAAIGVVIFAPYLGNLWAR